MFEALKEWEPDLIIADESQRIKTHDAQQSKAMHQLGDIAKYKLILSGTPVQNNAIDIFSQYRFLDPTVFGMNYYAFRGRYAIMGGFNQKQIIGYRDLDISYNSPFIIQQWFPATSIILGKSAEHPEVITRKVNPRYHR